MNYLAIDLGAGSGRGIVFRIEDGKLVSDEVHRFSGYAVKVGGDSFWDIDMIFSAVKVAIASSVAKGYKVDTIGIDSWGVDYAVINKDGRAEMPYHYRHKRTVGVIEDMNNNVIPSLDSYKLSGIAPNEFNTLYQLYCGVKSGQFANASRVIFMPNAIGYLLTGVVATEPTIASTSGFYNKDSGYIDELITKIGFDKSLLPEVRPTGSKLGFVKNSILKELGIKSQIKVILTCGHDTAAAIACTEGSGGGESLFLSSGTWSLFGSVIPNYLTTEEAFHAGYTNELGVNGVRLLKNIIGMWIIQECMRRWTAETPGFSYGDIDKGLKGRQLPSSLINVGARDFLAPDDMVDAIKGYYKRTNQAVLEDNMDIALSVYASLALEYRYALDELVAISGRSFKGIDIFGGGSRNALLCQLTADSLGMTVRAGITEASGCGNAILQMISTGELASLTEAAQLLANTYDVVTYQPMANDRLDELYTHYKALKSL